MYSIISSYESLHPILVHFPIALLSVYAILECIRFRKLMEWQSYFHIKAFLVIIGFFAAIAAYMAGPGGSEIHSWSGFAGITGSNGRPLVRQIVSMHSNFAVIVLIVFGIIAASYLILWIQQYYKFDQKIWNFFKELAHFMQKPLIIITLALVGLVAVMITGALGGAIVYGPSVDPIVSYIYSLFF